MTTRSERGEKTPRASIFVPYPGFRSFDWLIRVKTGGNVNRIVGYRPVKRLGKYWEIIADQSQ